MPKMVLRVLVPLLAAVRGRVIMSMVKMALRFQVRQYGRMVKQKE